MELSKLIPENLYMWSSNKNHNIYVTTFFIQDEVNFPTNYTPSPTDVLKFIQFEDFGRLVVFKLYLYKRGVYAESVMMDIIKFETEIIKRLMTPFVELDPKQESKFFLSLLANGYGLI